MTEITEALFFERHAKKIWMEPNTGCWMWHTGSNYPKVFFGGRKYAAHRLLYQIRKGPIPDGLELDHLCRVKCCCNPDHLEAVTHHVNTLRGDAGAHNRLKKKCLRGHLLIEGNYYVSKLGFRNCLTCKRERYSTAKADRVYNLTKTIESLKRELAFKDAEIERLNAEFMIMFAKPSREAKP